MITAQEYLRYEEMASLAVHCGIATEEDAKEEASDKLIATLADLLDRCGLEKNCALIKEKDYKKLTRMIDADSINYSPSRTFSDSEIMMLLDRIRRGY